MSLFKNDDLYEIFQRNLEQMQGEAESTEKLIAKTVDEYLAKLFGNGFIPLHFVEPIQVDLQREVEEMYRKKTYGFFSLNHYLTTKTTAPRKRKKSA